MKSREQSSRGQIQPEPQVVVVLAHDLPAQLLVESDSSQVIGLDAEFQDGVAGLGAEFAKIADELDGGSAALTVGKDADREQIADPGSGGLWWACGGRLHFLPSGRQPSEELRRKLSAHDANGHEFPDEQVWVAI